MSILVVDLHVLSMSAVILVIIFWEQIRLTNCLLRNHSAEMEETDSYTEIFKPEQIKQKLCEWI